MGSASRDGGMPTIAWSLPNTQFAIAIVPVANIAIA